MNAIRAYETEQACSVLGWYLIARDETTFVGFKAEAIRKLKVIGAAHVLTMTPDEALAWALLAYCDDDLPF